MSLGFFHDFYLMFRVQPGEGKRKNLHRCMRFVWVYYHLDVDHFGKEDEEKPVSLVGTTIKDQSSVEFNLGGSTELVLKVHATSDLTDHSKRLYLLQPSTTGATVELFHFRSETLQKFHCGVTHFFHILDNIIQQVFCEVYQNVYTYHTCTI